MKCPKCGYLGFEPVDRCRNCGYDFSLSSPVAMPDLPMRSERDDFSGAPMDDLPLGSGPDRLRGATAPPQQTPTELSLFGPPGLNVAPDDVPLITKASPPRQPLAVRRATIEIPRVRLDQPRMQTLDLDLEPDVPVAPGPTPARVRASLPRTARTEQPAREREAESAGLIARFFAVLIDCTILAAVDAVVIYFTMEICGLTAQDLGILPKGPLLAFLLVQNGGYLVAFTAGGQTLGKMTAGIRVVADAGSTLDLGRALLRTAIWLVLAAPVGLGFLPALFSADHRGLHDRFAGTRVVRASPA